MLSIPATNDTSTLWAMNDRRVQISEVYHKLFFGNSAAVSDRLDAILMPPAPHTAVPHDMWNRPAYTCIWNYVDYPALVIPVDKVRAGLDETDGVENAKYGVEDEGLYKLCKSGVCSLWKTIVRC